MSKLKNSLEELLASLGTGRKKNFTTERHIIGDEEVEVKVYQEQGERKPTYGRLKGKQHHDAHCRSDMTNDELQEHLKIYDQTGLT